MKYIINFLLLVGLVMNAYSDTYSISESMFSQVYDLSRNPSEILLRIHPNKRKAYDSIVSGGSKVVQDGKEITIADVNLLVNGSEGTYKIPYSKVYKFTIDHVVSSKSVPGFDADGDPYIYQLKDGTIRVVFFSMPPTNLVNRAPIDIDSISKDLASFIGVEVVRDDREVFHIQKPNENTISGITKFLSEYKINKPSTAKK